MSSTCPVYRPKIGENRQTLQKGPFVIHQPPGSRPDHLFVSRKGTPRTLRTIAIAIERSVLRYIGLKLTCHQFRHIAAKIHLDANPGAYEVVRQLLGHKDTKTTVKFYGGIDTWRAGRAHANLIAQLREARPQGKRPPSTSPQA